LTDWRAGRVKPQTFAGGRNYFLGGVRRTLEKLQELEAGRPAKSQDEPAAPPRVLH